MNNAMIAAVLWAAPIQQSDGPVGGRSPVDAADAVMQDFADCVVGQSGLGDDIRAFLRSSSSGEKNPNFELPSRCLGTYQGTRAIRFKPAGLRYALYEALYRRQFERTAAPLDFDRPLSLESEFDSEVPAWARPMRIIGDCVIRAAPADSRQLVLNRADSAQGAAAIQALVPQLAPCVPEGADVRFSKSVIRGLVAEALYKRAGTDVAAGKE